MIEKIVSGGQTGADQAALDVAIEMNIPHGGWIPKGRITEAGPLPDIYHLQEMPTTEYAKRTEQNVIDSDGTLILTHGRLSGGSLKTQDYAQKHKRPCLHICLTRLSVTDSANVIASWAVNNNIKVLNVAGPRLSKDPSIYEDTRVVLTEALLVMKTGSIPLYSMEFIEEDSKLYILFYDTHDKLVAKKELPGNITIDDYISMGNRN